MVGPMLHNGWVAVPYDGNERAEIRLAVGDQSDWKPAYRDWAGDTRVVKIRPPAKSGKQFVWLSVDGQVTKLGTVTL